MAEAHDALPLRKCFLHPLCCVTRPLDLVEHRLHVGRSAAVQRARERAYGRGEGGAAIRARRSDDASSERRRVQAVLGRADPVRIDRLHMTRVGLTTPPEQKLLRGSLATPNHIVGDDVRLSVGETRGTRDDRHHLRRQPAEILARLLVGDLVQLAELPFAGKPRRLGLEVCGRIAGEPRRLVRLGIRHLRIQVVVDEEAPDVLVGNLPDERLDVDTPVAKRPALAVGLHDLRLDGDDALEPRFEVVVAAHVSSSSSIARPTDRPFAAASTRAAAATSWTATPTDLYRVISSWELRPGFVPATSSPSSAWTSAGPRPTNSGAPAGGCASADTRDSTTSSASATVCSSTSRPDGLRPTELTWTPGESHSRRTIGSVACVVAATTSEPRIASSYELTARACGPISSASASALDRSRPATRISLNARTRGNARACERAWTPVPRRASTSASSRARSRVASAEPAAVRAAVMDVPSITARGVPFSVSKTTITAWCVCRSMFCGKSVTSLHASPADGRYAGITPRSACRSCTLAAIRGGIDASPALRSLCAAASASTSSSRSSNSRTSASERKITTGVSAAREPVGSREHDA